MPKIVRFHQLGGPENLKLEDLPQQQPGKGEVRLKVKASGLNRAESMFYHGQYLEAPKLPSRLGYEVAGVVDAVGEGVDKSWIGKPVSTVPGFSMVRYGTLGEEAVVPVECLGEYPANLTPTQAAAIWMQYLTAYGALVHIGGVKAGDFVSIPAASSSVGLAAIQIARDAARQPSQSRGRQPSARSCWLSAPTMSSRVEKKTTWHASTRSPAARARALPSTRWRDRFWRNWQQALPRAGSSSSMARFPCSLPRFRSSLRSVTA